MSSGKGSKPRNCFSKDFRANFEEINWGVNSKNYLPSEELSRNHRAFLFQNFVVPEGVEFCVVCDRPRVFKDGSCSFCEADELGD